MNWEHIEHNWTVFQGSARTKWDELTEDDLCRIEGNQLQLIGRIQERYSIARAEAERQVIEWAHSCRHIEPVRGAALPAAEIQHRITEIDQRSRAI
jgi:uncharacterized protein YjbJ (UPF0337 family)